MFTTQLPVPEQPPPLQPLNTKLLDGVAVKVTFVPLLKLAEVELQPVPHLMPDGELLTVPPLATFLFKVSAY